MKQGKKERARIQKAIKEALEGSESLKRIVEDIKELTAKKKDLEAAIKADFLRDIAKMDELKESIEADGQMLTDVAMNDYVNGKTVEIVEDSGLKYEPKFKVTFKKA